MTDLKTVRPLLTQALGYLEAPDSALQALRHAVEDEVVSANPGINVRMKNSVVDNLKAGDKKRALPPAGVRRLVEVVAHHDLEIMVHLLFSLGLRRGEALGRAGRTWTSGPARCRSTSRFA